MGFFMVLKTTLEPLEEVQSAISNIMLGQEVTHGIRRESAGQSGSLKGWRPRYNLSVREKNFELLTHRCGNRFGQSQDQIDQLQIKQEGKRNTDGGIVAARNQSHQAVRQ